MKTKNINLKAANDVLIEELPKADTINNSDLFVLQKLNGETEATSIQELTRKIQDGGTSYGEDLGQILFFTSRTQNPNMHAMDGTIGTKAEYPEFYNFLLTLNELEKQFWALNEVDETFFFKSLNNKFLKITAGSITTEGSSSNYVADHTHQVLGSYLDNFWINPQTGTKPSGARRVLVERATGEAIQKTSVALGTGSSTTPISENQAPSVLLYAYVVTKNLNRASSSLYIKSDGTVAMNNDYTPTDPLDVATKKYIDNKFLNYEIPLSFSINDIGKRIPYYKNAETNPTLIALDGTKYLISDYPDFDYETQEGFTNDGVYFWYNVFNLDILPTISTNLPYDNEINGYIRFSVSIYPITFNSKLVYNFLQTTEGQKLLVADGAGKDLDNFGFTILDTNNYQIRMNTNQNLKYRIVTNGALPENPDILGALNVAPTNTGNIAITEGKYLLKIKPDYMVAKIQQVGSGAGGGDLLADRSVLLTGTGTFNTKQITSMDDLKSENIIVGGNAKTLITLDTKLVEVDNSISTINNNIGSVNITGLKTQVDTNTTDITNIKTVNTNQDTSINNLQNQVNTNTQNITSLQTVANSVYKFARKLKRTATTSLTIAGNANKRILDDVTIDSSSPYNDTTSFTLEGTTNKIIREKDDDYKELAIAITLGHTANMGATKFEVQLWRNTPTPSIVRWGSKLEFNDPDERGNTTQILTYKAGINDPYVTNGYYIVLRNLTGNVLTYSIVDILITVAKDKLLGV